MGARTQLKTALEEAIEGVRVIADVRELPDLDPSYRYAIQLIRNKITPAGRLAQFLEEFELWVLSAKVDPETVEDALDDHVDEVVLFLDGLSWLAWSEGTRELNPDGYHGYKFTITAGTQREE